MADPAFAQLLQLYQSGQTALAEAKCRRFLVAHPKTSEAHHLLGAILLQANRRAEAILSFEAALLFRPGYVEALMSLGSARLMMGEPAQALSCFEKAARLKPNDHQALYHLGLVYLQLGRNEESRKTLTRLLARQPDNALALVAQGTALASLGRFQEAIGCFQKSCKLAPTQPDGFENLALAYIKTRQFIEAETAARNALTLAPRPRAQAILGHALYLLDRLDEAAPHLSAAMAADPSDIGSRTLLASSFRRLGDPGRAYELLSGFERDHPEVRLGLGMCLKDMGRIDQAITVVEDAIHERAASPDLLRCRSQLMLQAGRLQEAWQDFDQRFVSFVDPVQRLSWPFAPLEPGEDLSSQTVLIWPEQGIGDQITFASALPDLIERAGGVEVFALPKLAGLLERSFPDARIITRGDQSRASRHMPAGDLFKLFRARVTDFSGLPYLKPDPAFVLKMRARLDALGPGLKVGIGWSSTLVTPERRKFFFSSLADWGPILSVPGVVFVNLQPNVDLEILEAARSLFACRIESLDDVDLFDDLDSLAALTAALDLVICNGSANALLASAVGAPVWLFYLSDSHWDRLGTDRIPWLGSLVAVERLWNEGWEGAIERMGGALRASVEAGQLVAPIAASPLRHPA
ncbi:MAG: tetratricopeptide repeat protein [Alphaproteobacteria bacterium]|nr:tetratricopeptide repeat protein [Alphaproteobacteria bacterium]